MGFNTLAFVFAFLPLFLAAFYLVPARWRAGLLCLGSLVFYVVGVWQRPWCLAPLLGLAVLVYLLGLRMRPRESRGLLVLGLAALFGCLFFFKYAGLLGLGVTLPLAISFYSFQLAAYLIDVYRGRVPAERKPLLFFTGVLLFPKLLSGPLMDPLSLQQQLSAPPRPGLEDFDSGLRDFVLGLSMKVLLANQIGGLWRQVGNIGYESVSTPLAWMGIAAYSLQLYLDFCGYSWMALGLGRMLGFRLPRNFEHPYAARSMQDFWRRWHISLSSWFRDYVYIPMGGNRVPPLRRYFNILVVWMLTGLWHGADWNFVLWGLFFAVFLMLEKAFLLKPLQKLPVISHIYTLLLVTVSFVLFDSSRLSEAFLQLGRMFGAGGVPLYTGEALYYLGSYAVTFIIAIIGATPYPTRWMQKLSAGERTGRVMAVAAPVVLLLLLAVVTAYLVDGSFNPFLYFRF